MAPSVGIEPTTTWLKLILGYSATIDVFGYSKQRRRNPQLSSWCSVLIAQTKTSINTRQTRRRDKNTSEISFLFFLNLFLLFFTSYLFSQNNYSLSHKHDHTSTPRCSVNTLLSMHKHAPVTLIFFISRTNNQLRRIKAIPKIVALLSIIADKENASAGYK